MEIQKLQTHHLSAVKTVYLESRQSTFTWLDSAAFAWADFERDSEGENIWIALESDQVVGFISIWERAEFIHHLFVSPGHLRRGAGSALLSFAKQRYTSLSLKCLTQNSNAIDFYLSQGFTIIETIEDGARSYHLMHYIN